jgi:dihydrofolate reductase
MLFIIAAIGKNNIIGINNDLPWKLSGDLKYFAKTTTGKSVLMGRKTFDSILSKLGKPLPNRKNYVLSRTENFLEGVEIIKDLQAFEKQKKDEEVFIIGGASVYEQALPLVDKMYITEVECDCQGDAFFPKFNADEWNLISEEKHSKDEKNEYNYNFKIYDRKK